MGRLSYIVSYAFPSEMRLSQGVNRLSYIGSYAFPSELLRRHKAAHLHVHK